jgi:hypothetical protein
LPGGRREKEKMVWEEEETKDKDDKRMSKNDPQPDGKNLSGVKE